MKSTRRIMAFVTMLLMLLSLTLPAYGWEQRTEAREADPIAQSSASGEQITVQARAAALQQPSKEEIIAKWNLVTSSTTIFAAEPSITAPHVAGSLTEEFLESGLTYLNYVRFVAGLPEVTLDDTLNEDAQHGAVVLAAIDQLTHYPAQPEDMDDAFYERGYAATSSSNISARWGYSDLTNMLKSAVQGCMNDNNSLGNLTTVGHRRWLLNPTLGKVGFGYAESAEGWSYIVNKIFDRSGAGCSYDFISWPVAGNHPTNLFDSQNPWSVTLNPSVYQNASASNLAITITRVADGKQWSLDGTTGEPNYDVYGYIAPYLTADSQGYGVRSCIIFHPGSEAVESYEGVFQVKITGLSYANGTAAELNYEVDFFDINSLGCDHNYISSVTAPTCTEQGYTTYTCSKCGDSYVSDYTDPVGHSYEDGKCVWCGVEAPNGQPCGDNAYWSYENGILTISGTGPTYDYAYDGAPWFEYRDRITAIVVNDGITRLGEYIFTDLDNLVSADLSDTITEIGSFAFWGDEKLSQAELPENLESLGQEAFACCALTSVELPGSLTFLDACVFQYCTSLTDVVIHSGDVGSMTFGNSPFRGCTALENIYVDDDHFALFDDDGILYGYFNEGYELLQYPLGRKNTVLEIADGTLIINMLALEAASNLEEVIIPASLREIYTFAFSGSTNLKTIRFLGDAPAIQDYAFNGITADCCYPADNETWTADVMQNYGGTITWVPVEMEIPEGWVQENGIWYYYADGEAQTGWQYIGNQYYYFDADGSMATGWVLDNNVWFYMDESGAMATGWRWIGGAYYYFNSNGAMATGWVKSNNTWYYMRSNGTMATGWVQVGNTWYYMNSSGAMQTGWLQLGGKRYYLNESGAMVTGWLKSGNTYYYFDANGAMATGWRRVNGVYYFLNEDGKMQTGWLLTGGKYYYLKPNGAMATGWVLVGSDWYFMNSSGAMHTGWLQQGSTWYYLKPNGAMATGKYWMNNRYYYFDANGVWIG